jgi:hypothetical protein
MLPLDQRGPVIGRLAGVPLFRGDESLVPGDQLLHGLFTCEPRASWILHGLFSSWRDGFAGIRIVPES